MTHNPYEETPAGMRAQDRQSTIIEFYEINEKYIITF
jgi:hypothetical protein